MPSASSRRVNPASAPRVAISSSACPAPRQRADYREGLGDALLATDEASWRYRRASPRRTWRSPHGPPSFLPIETREASLDARSFQAMAMRTRRSRLRAPTCCSGRDRATGSWPTTRDAQPGDGLHARLQSWCGRASQFAGKQPLTRRPALGDPKPVAGYSANVPQPRDLIPAANDRRPRVPPTLEPPRSTREQAWTARAGGNAHLGGTRRVARAKACSIVASRSTSRPGLPNAATVTTTPGRCRRTWSGSSAVTWNAESLRMALLGRGAGSADTTS